MGAQSLGTAALAHLGIGTSTSASDIGTLQLICEFVSLLRRDLNLKTHERWEVEKEPRAGPE